MFRRQTALQKQASKAWEYIRKLFGLTLTRIVLVILIVLIAFPFVLFYFLKPESENDNRYGVTFSNKYASQIGLDWKDAYIKVLDDLGARNLRLVAYWDDIEVTPQNYNYKDIKWQLEQAEKRNANVILAVGRKVPRYPECFEPSWWRGMSSEDERNKELFEYCKNHPYIFQIDKTIGGSDFEIEIYAQSKEHFKEIMQRLQDKFSMLLKNYTGLFRVKIRYLQLN